VRPYLIDRFEAWERKRYILLACVRFAAAVQEFDGTETEKVAAAMKDLLKLVDSTYQKQYTTTSTESSKITTTKTTTTIIFETKLSPSDFLIANMIYGGGAKGVLCDILRYV